MQNSETVDFLVIGAGLAGLACAGDLAATGATVQIVDKGRGVGGRMATRRWADGDNGTTLRVDHGAQFFTARGERFQSLIDAAQRDGWVRPWSRGFPQWKDGTITARPEGHTRYCAPGGMSDLPKHLAKNLTVETGFTVNRLTRADDGVYTAQSAEGGEVRGRSLVLNLPPAQALPLARPLLDPETVARLEAVTYDPAWTLLLRLHTDIPGATWPAVEFAGHPVLGWLSRDHTKRPSPDAPPVLVVHGSGAWSRDHLEDDPAAVRDALTNALQSVVGPLEIREATTHRWRYATPTAPLSDPFFWDSERGIGVCGDWCYPGGRVEGAITSGWSLAEALRG